MNISDLNHVEEVVFEVPSIIGGRTVISDIGTLAPDLVNLTGLDPELKFKLNLETVKNSDGSSATTGIGTIETGGQVVIAESNSVTK